VRIAATVPDGTKVISHGYTSVDKEDTREITYSVKLSFPISQLPDTASCTGAEGKTVYSFIYPLPTLETMSVDGAKRD
jgi:hypothetical protein